MQEQHEKRQMVQIPSEQVKKLLEIDKIRSDLANYPISKKVHLLLQEKLAEVFQSKSWFPHQDGMLKGRWFEYIRELFPMHIFAPIAVGVVNYSKEMIGEGYTKILVATESDKTWWGNHKDDVYNVGNYLVKNLKNKSFAKTYYDKYLKFFEEMKKRCKEIRELDFSKCSKDELLEKYNVFYEKTKRYHALSFDIDAIDIVLEENMSKKFRALLKTKYGEVKAADFNTKYGMLTTPDELSYLNKEQLEVYHLVKEIKDNKKLKELFSYDIEVLYPILNNDYSGIIQKIDKLVKEYWWINLGWTIRAEKQTMHFIFDIKKILKENPNVEHEIKRIKDFSEKTKKDKKVLAKELSFDEETNHYIDIFEHYIAIHDWRKEIQMKTTACLNLFLDEISRRYSHRYDDLVWCWPWEIVEIIKTGKMRDELYPEIRKRKETYYTLTTAEGIEYHTGEMSIKKRKEELAADIGNIHNFSGIIASIGKVTGKAKLCFSSQQALQKVEKGDILIASMTQPDFLPAMKKASAIITDEGGITCHAAIISREFKIPCIVGTKIATRVINDGDIIEVNANHGTVKIITRKE